MAVDAPFVDLQRLWIAVAQQRNHAAQRFSGFSSVTTGSIRSAVATATASPSISCQRHSALKSDLGATHPTSPATSRYPSMLSRFIRISQLLTRPAHPFRPHLAGWREKIGVFACIHFRNVITRLTIISFSSGRDSAIITVSATRV